MRSLIRAFASCLTNLWLLGYWLNKYGVSQHNRSLYRLIWIDPGWNELLEIRHCCLFLNYMKHKVEEQASWAKTQENLSAGVCEQQRHRPACASTQSDQRLCYSLIRKYHIKACFKRYFYFLASLCSWTDWFESHFVGNLEDRFCRVKAKLIVIEQC